MLVNSFTCSSHVLLYIQSLMGHLKLLLPSSKPCSSSVNIFRFIVLLIKKHLHWFVLETSFHFTVQVSLSDNCYVMMKVMSWWCCTTVEAGMSEHPCFHRAPSVSAGTVQLLLWDQNSQQTFPPLDPGVVLHLLSQIFRHSCLLWWVSRQWNSSQSNM